MLEDYVTDVDHDQLMLTNDHAQPQAAVHKETTVSKDQTVDELPISGGADLDRHDLQSNASKDGECGGSEVTSAERKPPVRRSTRAGAGQHSNPYHLPRPVLRERVTAEAAAAVTESDVLNSLAQSNLLIAQLLAKNVRL